MLSCNDIWICCKFSAVLIACYKGENAAEVRVAVEKLAQYLIDSGYWDFRIDVLNVAKEHFTPRRNLELMNAFVLKIFYAEFWKFCIFSWSEIPHFRDPRRLVNFFLFDGLNRLPRSFILLRYLFLVFHFYISICYCHSLKNISNFILTIYYCFHFFSKYNIYIAIFLFNHSNHSIFHWIIFCCICSTLCFIAYGVISDN